MTAVEQEDRLLKQKLAQMEATFDAYIDDIEEHEDVIERLEGLLDGLGKEISAARRQLGMDDQS